MRALSGQQVRQLVDTTQLFETLLAAERDREERFRGSMTWKQVNGGHYLYRKRRSEWKSVGPRSAATEHAFEQFHSGRAEIKARIASLGAEVERMAPINRAMGLGRVPWISGRILRRLDRENLLGHGLTVVGTHAMFAYERLASVHFDTEHVTTADIDLLYDARASLRLVGPEVIRSGLIGQLRKVDRSFAVPPGGFRAANDAGFLVDLIAPQPRLSMARVRRRIGDDEGDQSAAEIEGLAWLESSGRIAQVVIDEKGFPLRMLAPDPRAFAVHKIWLAERADREPGKKRRDLAQARAVLAMIRSHLRDMPLDDQALSAFPAAVREPALALARAWEADGPKLDETDWR